jgi:hypothetical protein
VFWHNLLMNLYCEFSSVSICAFLFLCSIRLRLMSAVGNSKPLFGSRLWCVGCGEASRLVRILQGGDTAGDGSLLGVK